MRVLNRHFRSKLYSCAIDLSRALSIDHPTVKHRLKVLDFYSRYGLQASLEAFGISKSTLFNWRKAYRSGGLRGLLPLPKTFALCRVLSCVSLSTLPGLMHHLYNRGFALAVSMPKLVPLVIVYLCGLIAGGGLQVLILPNAMGHKKAHIHSSHLLP